MLGWLLVGLVVVAVGAPILLARRPGPRLLHPLLGLWVGGAVGLPLFWTAAHFTECPCDEGPPLLFLVAPTLAFASAVPLCPRARWALLVLPLLAGYAVVPALAWTRAAHGHSFAPCEGCVAVESPPPPHSWIRRITFRGQGDGRNWPAGWLEESPVLDAYPETRPFLTGDFRKDIQDTPHGSHYFLTGLADWYRGPGALWYPGGTLAEAAHRVRCRAFTGGP